MHFTGARRARGERGLCSVGGAWSASLALREWHKKRRKEKSEFGKKTIKLGFGDGVAFISFVFRQTADDQSVL